MQLVNNFLSGALFLSVFLSACVANKPAPKKEPTLEDARALAEKFIIIDGHVDLPYRLRVKNFRLERQYMHIPVSSKDGRC